MIYKPWFEAIDFVGRGIVLSMILAYFFKEMSLNSDQDNLELMCLKPVKLFDYPVSVECSNSKCHFVRGWLNRFPWLAYSTLLDGAFVYRVFCLESSRGEIRIDSTNCINSTTLWTSAMSRFTKHGSGKCEMHNFSLIAMDNLT